MRIALFQLLLICSLSGAILAESAESNFLQITNKFAQIQATLQVPEKPTKIAVIQAHPWGNSLGDTMPLAKRGFAVLSVNTRAVNKDDLAPNEILETLLLDVAAAVQEMKDRGYKTVILMGRSAGGPLMSLYQNVAENGNGVFAGGQKLFKFPGFFEGNGNPMSLPKGDGLIFQNPIDGTSTTFLNRLDPSVMDEATGQRDPSLDMYNPANGYNQKAGAGTYSKEFIKQYGRAQAARMNRIIEAAQQRMSAVKQGKAFYPDDDLITISRTRARLLYTDMKLGHGKSAHLILPEGRVAIPAHDRAPGHYSLFGEIPDRNSSVMGAVVCTTRSFFSSRAVRAQWIDPMATTLEEWGVDVQSTNNTTVGNMMHVNAPWVIFAGTADDKINTAELIYNEASAKDKKIIFLHGATHSMTSVDPKRFLETPALRELMAEEIGKWIDQRFK
jgi:hypothetical protein